MKPRIQLLAEIDPAELAIRMCEASYGLKRPMPNAQAALEAMDDDCREGWQRAAIAALEYLRECIAIARPPS
jgi:hypothetical protein